MKRYSRLSPAQIILLGFIALILAGAFLLMLPISSQQGRWTPFLDALFTATSASCVTGLVVYDTAQYWSSFGQGVILLLIQIGGIGVVTVAIAIGMLSGKKIGFKHRWIMQESISAPGIGGVLRLTGFVFKSVFLVEGIGALLLAVRFCPEFGFWKGLWYSVFHSISAFCNAGFDLMGIRGTPFSSLTAYAADPWVNTVIILLIVVSGLGFLTLYDMGEYGFKFKQYRLQSKIILCTTGGLLLSSFAFFLFYEFQLPQWAGMTVGEQIQAAAFQAVTPRTAGFNTVDLAALSPSSQLITILLMLIGGSPGSTAGGFKTTTFAVLLLSIRAALRQREHTECFGRRLPSTNLQNACVLFVIYLLLFLGSGIAICCVEQIPMMDALFETASAVATVGLTLGHTPNLSAVSHTILIFLMYFGRVGGLTMLYAVTVKGLAVGSQYPQEAVAIG